MAGPDDQVLRARRADDAVDRVAWTCAGPAGRGRCPRASRRGTSPAAPASMATRSGAGRRAAGPVRAAGTPPHATAGRARGTSSRSVVPSSRRIASAGRSPNSRHRVVDEVEQRLHLRAYDAQVLERHAMQAGPAEARAAADRNAAPSRRPPRRLPFGVECRREQPRGGSGESMYPVRGMRIGRLDDRDTRPLQRARHRRRIRALLRGAADVAAGSSRGSSGSPWRRSSERRSGRA